MDIVILKYCTGISLQHKIGSLKFECRYPMEYYKDEYLRQFLDVMAHRHPYSYLYKKGLHVCQTA